MKRTSTALRRQQWRRSETHTLRTLIQILLPILKFVIPLLFPIILLSSWWSSLFNFILFKEFQLFYKMPLTLIEMKIWWYFWWRLCIRSCGCCNLIMCCAVIFRCWNVPWLNAMKIVNFLLCLIQIHFCYHEICKLRREVSFNLKRSLNSRQWISY